MSIAMTASSRRSARDRHTARIVAGVTAGVRASALRRCPEARASPRRGRRFAGRWHVPVRRL